LSGTLPAGSLSRLSGTLPTRGSAAYSAGNPSQPHG
jgi:hypothetical protein